MAPVHDRGQEHSPEPCASSMAPAVPTVLCTIDDSSSSADPYRHFMEAHDTERASWFTLHVQCIGLSVFPVLGLSRSVPDCAPAVLSACQCSEWEGRSPKTHEDRDALLSYIPDKHTAIFSADVRKVCCGRATVVLRFPCVTLVAMGLRVSRRLREYHEWRMVEATTWSLWAYCQELAHERGAHHVVRTTVYSM